MKLQIILLYLLVLLFNHAVFSQSHYLGPKGGLNWGNRTNSNHTAEFIQRSIFGIDYRFRYKKGIKIGVSLLYSQAGYKDDIDGTPYDYKSIYDYISIPLKAGYEYGDKWFVFGEIGVSQSYLLRATHINPIFNQENELIEVHKLDFKDYTPSYEYGGHGTLGFGRTLFEKIGVFMEGNYYHSFTSIYTKDYFPFFKIYQYSFSARLGVRFKL